jgi:hypothetical protein
MNKKYGMGCNIHIHWKHINLGFYSEYVQVPHELRLSEVYSNVED